MAWISRVYSNSIEFAQAQIKIKSQEDELARLRKLPKRPKFRPNGMEPRNRIGGKKSPALTPLL